MALLIHPDGERLVTFNDGAIKLASTPRCCCECFAGCLGVVPGDFGFRVISRDLEITFSDVQDGTHSGECTQCASIMNNTFLMPGDEVIYTNTGSPMSCLLQASLNAGDTPCPGTTILLAQVSAGKTPQTNSGGAAVSVEARPGGFGSIHLASLSWTGTAEEIDDWCNGVDGPLPLTLSHLGDTTSFCDFSNAAASLAIV